jgi:PAS domain S-box-containing protein
MKIQKVLVVDNNTTIVELVGNLLAGEGYQVSKAYDGIGALDTLEEGESLPDAVILDLVMPKIDGQRLTRILRSDGRYAHIPIIILSGIAAEEDGRIFEFGADAFIAKGKVDDTFKHILDTLRWLEERPASDEKKEEVLGVEKLYPREMTKELLLVKQHFDSMFNLMQEGVIEIDQNHRVLFVNPAAQRLLGQEDHLLFGKPVVDLFEDREGVKDYLDRLPGVRDKTAESIQLTCRDHIARAIASPFFLEKEYIGAVVILQDVTALVHRERSLEGRMTAIVENAPVGLCLLDDKGRILVAHPRIPGKGEPCPRRGAGPPLYPCAGKRPGSQGGLLPRGRKDPAGPERHRQGSRSGRRGALPSSRRRCDRQGPPGGKPPSRKRGTGQGQQVEVNLSLHGVP